MANVTVQRQPSACSPIGAQDPVQMFRALLKTSPLRQLGPPAFAPPFQVRETKDRYVFKADMPGLQDAELDIDVTGDRMRISGTREIDVDKSDTVYTEERTFGAFARSFVLPKGADVDHVQAALQEGVLTIAIPKADAKAGKNTL